MGEAARLLKAGGRLFENSCCADVSLARTERTDPRRATAPVPVFGLPDARRARARAQGDHAACARERACAS